MLDRKKFLDIAANFIEWAGTFRVGCDGNLTPARLGALSELSINLNINNSSKVPNGIRRKINFHELTKVFIWRAPGMRIGNFTENNIKILELSNSIKNASTNSDALEACEKILEWGGNRNKKSGALPFLKSHRSLLNYLESVRQELNLKTAVIPANNKFIHIQLMNSMLTKVHSFFSNDGLPIYDSRVAGAIATIVATWLTEKQIGNIDEVHPMIFPEVGGGGLRRSVLARYPDYSYRRKLNYPTKGHEENTTNSFSHEWAAAKIRLGWLLESLLEEKTPGGIRSLEACLFIAGYDCAAINRP
jgi:hypothetical protein